MGAESQESLKELRIVVVRPVGVSAWRKKERPEVFSGRFLTPYVWLPDVDSNHEPTD
jgi:hypothetical protein